MAFVVKFVKTVRNNWKKSVLFTGLAAYGVYYARGVYEDSLIRQAYCEQAKKYGEVPLRTGEQARKVTVFLNPAAQKGKAKKLFDKNVAPILNLAGFEVNLVRTEYEGQAKKYMDVLDKSDAILVAGGDGTLAEVVTGLLRRKDEAIFSKIPIGVIPLGLTNSLATSLIHKDKSQAKWLLDSALAVVYGCTKPVDIMSITGDDDKSVFAVNALEWGAYKEAELRAKKYWYFGPLKKYWTYVMSTVGQWPPVVRAKLSYTYPCEGCSNCYKPPEKPVWRWWHMFISPAVDVPKKDYSEVVNTACGVRREEDLSTIQLRASTSNTDSTDQTNADFESGIKLHVESDSVSKTDFIKTGKERRQGTVTDNRIIVVDKFTLEPVEGHQVHDVYIIDNEPYEHKPIEVRLLRDKLNVFYASTL